MDVAFGEQGVDTTGRCDEIASCGLLSFLAGMRRREVGIRPVVGTTRGQVFRLVVGSGARLVGVGLGVGLALSAGVGMALQSLLVGISPAGPLTYTGGVGVLVAVAAGRACCRRAGRPRSTRR